MILTELMQGGWVMAPLLIGSIVAFAVILERCFYFVQLEWGGEAFKAKLQGLVRDGKRAQAVEWMGGLKGPIPAVLAAGINQSTNGPAAMEAAMAAQAKRLQPSLFNYISVLETAVTASPLVGLLGTILGMMGVFHVVAERLAHNPNADTNGITAGIGEALISTASGIFLAVLCLLFNNLFVRLAETQIERTESMGADLLASQLAPTSKGAGGEVAQP
jgi:biopolymer transport protein ExbB